MIIPYVSSVSEDAMKAVPMQIREGSYATGATKFQTAFKVVIPAAFSGLQPPSSSGSPERSERPWSWP